MELLGQYRKKDILSLLLASKTLDISDDIHAPPASACKAPTEMMKEIQAMANFRDKRDPFFTM